MNLKALEAEFILRAHHEQVNTSTISLRAGGPPVLTIRHDAPEGYVAFAVIREAIARAGGSLYDHGTQQYIVGNIAQLLEH